MAGERFLADKAAAWDAVVKALHYARPDWWSMANRGVDAAVAAIKELGELRSRQGETPSGATSEQVAVAPKGSACESPALLTSNPKSQDWLDGFEAAKRTLQDRADAWSAVAERIQWRNKDVFLAHKTGLQCVLDEIDRLYSARETKAEPKNATCEDPISEIARCQREITALQVRINQAEARIK